MNHVLTFTPLCIISTKVRAEGVWHLLVIRQLVGRNNIHVTNPANQRDISSLGHCGFQDSELSQPALFFYNQVVF